MQRCTQTCPAPHLIPGEKLDYKTCEALEEVFKRLQFRVVDLEQTNLDEDVSSPCHQPYLFPKLPGSFEV